MFPIAHAWLLEQVVDRPSPAHYLGCVWPDMLFGSPLDHQRSHRSGEQLHAYAQHLDGPEGEALRAFVAGVLTHGTEPHGFDWYSDECYDDRPLEERGYAFQRGHPFAHAASSACGLPDEHGWWKAHNLVEMAFERRLHRARPELGAQLSAACANETLVGSLARSLASLFGVSPAALTVAMRRFPEVVHLRPATAQDLADTYAAQTRLKHAAAQPDRAALAALIEEVEDAIAPDWHTFLASTALCVSRTLDAYPALRMPRPQAGE